MVLPIESVVYADPGPQMTTVEIMDHLIKLACKMYDTGDCYRNMLLDLNPSEKAMACELIIKRIDVIETARRAVGWIERWSPCRR